MAKRVHVEIVKKGADAIAAWRKTNPRARLDLRRVDLSEAGLCVTCLSEANLRQADGPVANLPGADLSGANLRETDLAEANLFGADLSGADLSMALLNWAELSDAKLAEADLDDASLEGATLSGADLRWASLRGANLTSAYLGAADLSWACLELADLTHAALTNAHLRWAELTRADLSGADLSGANLEGAFLSATIFADVDLSQVQALEKVDHSGPCKIGVDTLFKSKGKIPDVFLRGCGVPDVLIEYLPSLIGAMEAIQFYSCFISYSSQDDAFARRLHARLEGEKLRVWFAPEAMRGGRKIDTQIDEAIRMYDRLLLVLSDSSMQSEWVRREIKKARKKERETGRNVLFPVSVVPFAEIRAWQCLEADSGEDLAEKVHQYHILDFSN